VATTKADEAASSANNANNSYTAADVARAQAQTTRTQAQTSATQAQTSATNSEASRVLSESWAVGGTGTRPGEDINNAKHWAALAAGTVTGVASFNGRQGHVTPQAGDYTAADVDALPISGGTLTGKLTLPESTPEAASLRITSGGIPQAANMVPGDLWMNGSTLYFRAGGNTASIYNSVNLIQMGQVEAEAGTGTAFRIVSAQRIGQAIAAQALAKTNTVEFAPTADYHPTTKLYVDTKAAGAAVAMTLSVDAWTGTGPYTQTKTVSGITVNTNGVLGLGKDASAEARAAARDAMLSITAQGPNSITITADGDKPMVSIPLRLIVLG
jgi:hypothetical protein